MTTAMTTMTPAPPVEFSELKTTELCYWCQSDVAVDARGFIVCPHCDRPCARKLCFLCERVNVQTVLSPAELAAAACTDQPTAHVSRPRRFWYALRTWLPPYLLDLPESGDGVDA